MILNKRQVQELYDGMAKYYDAALLGYWLTGVNRQRRKLVAQLGLREGDVVVDLGAGTGANVPCLIDAVGQSGRIIEVDISQQMLNRGRAKAMDKNWSNVEFIREDIIEFSFPSEPAAVIATFSLEMVPDYHRVIERLAGQIRPGGRLGLLGLKHPEKWPDWLIELGIWLNKPFGVSREYEKFRPWEAAAAHMEIIEYRELLFGAAYFCVAESKIKS